MQYRLYNGECCLKAKGCCRHTGRLNSYDYFSDIAESEQATDYVEVQFKNARKGYYLNSSEIPLERGDIVAVESSIGHDIGTVAMTGKLVLLQMARARLRPNVGIRRIYRKARPVDIEKYEEAKTKEHETMIRSRKIAEKLGLQMKIGDVEYQGDGTKAIFYYIADERIDFRQLIKDLAEAFHIRIEMKQIGARQEAARIGGTGPCGRELCCSNMVTGFSSVSTVAVRLQDVAMNPQKLVGQCAKLKCCFNYEADAYMEAMRNFPSREILLETQNNVYYHFKTDVFKNRMTYSTEKNFAANTVIITAERALEVINMNKKGHKPASLLPNENRRPVQSKEYQDVLEENVNRFDTVIRKTKRRRSSSRRQRNHKQTGEK